MENVQQNIVDSDMQSFAADVIEASKQQLVMVDFWADWCGPCKSLRPILENLVNQYQGKVKLVKIDTEAHQELAAQFGIRSLPTVFFFKEGKPVDQFMGVQPEAAIRQMIDRHLADQPTGNPAEAELEAAAVAYDGGQEDEAKAFVMQLIQADPSSDKPKLLLLSWLCKEGNMDEAKIIAEAVSVDGKGSVEFKAYLSSVEMQSMLQGLPAEAELLAAIKTNESDLSARFKLAQRCVATQQNEAGLAHLLEIIRRDRGYDDEAARKMMIKVFESLNSRGELVAKYRGLLARALN